MAITHEPPVSMPAALSAREIWVRLLLYPTHSLPTAIAPVLVGMGLAWRDGLFEPLPVLLGFFASWVIHVGGLFNDNHELLRRYPDLLEHPELNQALKDGTLSLAGLRNASLACVALALATGPYLIAVGGWLAFWFGVVGLASAYFYADGPKPYTHLGLADPLFIVMFGFVAPVGTYYIQWAAAHPEAPHDIAALLQLPLAQICIVGLPIGALVTNVMVIDDIRDRRFDAVKGWRTMSTNFGLQGGRNWYLGLSIVSFALPFMFWLGMGFSAWVLLPLLTLPLAIHVVHGVRTRAETRELIMMTPRAAFLSAIFGSLLGIGVAVG
jgi:1,4-dihydroxy-2-naphthoate octaprenyltransferase